MKVQRNHPTLSCRIILFGCQVQNVSIYNRRRGGPREFLVSRRYRHVTVAVVVHPLLQERQGKPLIGRMDMLDA